MSERTQDEVQDRVSRDSETRKTEVRTASWTPPTLLPTPPDTDEHVFRWVRVGMMGEADTRNVSMRFREGWEPIQAREYQELMVVPDPESPWSEKGAIEIGGLLLCKAPREMREARRRYHEEQTQQQMEAVDSNYMRESDPRMPVMPSERKTTRSSFGE